MAYPCRNASRGFKRPARAALRVAFVVFLRGVNVGGAKSFKPSRLAAELADLGVTNVGAAGTFVVRGGASAAGVAKRFREAMPVEADVIAVPGAQVADLVRRDPLKGRPADEAPHVSVMASAPKTPRALPLDHPAGAAWEVRVVAVEGPFALSVRRVGGGKSYPNEVVEKAFGVRATTRSWSTMATLAKKLDAP